MTAARNPALTAFLAQFPGEITLAQVLLRRGDGGFELRHADDADAADDALKPLATSELRTLAQVTATGAFRPLKSAPNLQRGWRWLAAGETELEAALNILYPGALADWLAAQAATPPVTHYRAFTERQTGMYRIATMLDDPAAERVARAGCDRRFCLKQRLWTVGALAADSVATKSLIPCLEPCAILLELARKAVRIGQEDKVTLALAPEEGATLLAALAGALARPDPGVREGDTGSPGNPRRLLLTLEKLRPFFDVPPAGKSAE